MRKKQYPQIGLRSKNEIAKRISSDKFSSEDALALINDVLKNFDSYWYDSKHSKPEEQKFVRSAAKSPNLKKLLKLINTKILAPYDNLVPKFIFGGLSGKNNIQAARYLLGKERNRTLLKLDVKTFFEQIRQERVFYFFYKKCGCSVKAARILSSLCCVPRGQKGSGSKERILARGFATSSRLAMWCNIGTFQYLDWKIKKELKGHDARIAIYVDDIGVTASSVEEHCMEAVKLLAIDILENKDGSQPLPIHRDERKTKIIKFKDGAQHLGVKLGRNKLSLGKKTRLRFNKIKFAFKNAKNEMEKIALLEKLKTYYKYKYQVEKRGK